MKTFNTEFTVYFEDIAPSGKIHLEKLTEWMSMTREEYFKATCPDHLKFVESPVKMFTTEISLSILGSSCWSDKVTAFLTTANIKKISFEMHIDFLSAKTGQIFARGVQKVAFVNLDTKKFAPVPQDMNSVIVNYTK